MKKELTIAFLMVGLTVGLSSTVTADEEETSVDVEISGVTQLDVRPSSLEYTGENDNEALSPGDARVVSDDGYEHIEVENIGSERIGTIYAQGTMHDEQPFGTFTDDENDPQHNTGNFVTVSLDEAQDYGLGGLSEVDTMHYLNRVEYYEDNPPTYIQTLETGDDLEDPDDAGTLLTDIEETEVGRFRVGGAEYFFVVYEDSDDSYMLIGDAPHTSTVLGTTDFTNDGDLWSPEEVTGSTGETGVDVINSQDFVNFDTSDSDYDGERLVDGGNADQSEVDRLDGEVRTYNLYVDEDGFVTRTKFNLELDAPDNSYTTDFSEGAAQEYIFDAEDSENSALQPGQNFPINFGVQVPLGVDQNAIDEGTVTVISETFDE